MATQLNSNVNYMVLLSDFSAERINRIGFLLLSTIAHLRRTFRLLICVVVLLLQLQR